MGTIRTAYRYCVVPYDTIVTHEFALDDYRTAVETAIDRKHSRAIKVVFRPNGG